MFLRVFKRANYILVALLVFIIPIILPVITFPQESKPTKEFTALYTKEKPVIDGNIEDIWKEGLIEGDFISLVTGEPSKEKTKVYVLWDENYLYAAFEAMVLDIKSIKAVSKIRDEKNLRYDDMVGILIDTYGDGRGLYRFGVNPLGTQFDESSRDEEWNGTWESSAKILNDTWTVEIKIPFKILKYYAKEEQTWGIQFGRDHRQASDTSVLFYSGKAHSGDPLYFPRLKGIKVKGGALEKKFLGYGVFQDREDEPKRFNIGLDISYPFTPSLTGNLALYPDFSEVETDEVTAFPQQFERFLPERRAFFKEGARYFTSKTGELIDLPGTFKIFHSRKIGRIDLGGKVSGKIGDYSIGALHTEIKNEKNRVVKIARDFGKKGYLGIINVEKEKDNVSSSSLDIESSIKLSKNFSFNFERAQSFNETKGSAYQTLFSYVSDENFVELGYFDINKDFNPPNGFARLTDSKGIYFFADYFKDYGKGKLKKFYTNTFIQDLKRHDSSELYKTTGFVSYILTRNNTALGYSHANDKLLDKKSFYHDFSVGFDSNDWKKANFYYSFGEFKDLPSHYYGFSKGFSLIPKISNFKSYYNLDVSKFTQDGVLTKNLYHRLNFIYEFNPKTTLSLSSRLDQKGNLNLFLVYRKRTGVDTNFYLVLGDPNSTKTSERIAIKASFPLFK